jgi:F-type H+-transporting ATPase subunit a
MSVVNLLASGDPMEHVLPHDLFHWGPITVTNQMLMALVAALLMLLIFPVLFRKTSTDAPSGGKNFFEAILSFLREEVFRPALKENTDRFVPFLWTLFFFILFCNLLGQIPIAEIVSLLTWHTSHVGGTATGNVNTTGALAVCAFLMIHFSGIVQVARHLISGTYGHHHAPEPTPRGEALMHHEPHATEHEIEHGKGMNPALAILLAPFYYLWNFAPHPFKPEHGQSQAMWLLDLPMFTMLLVLELIGALIKPFALMIRLFANMIAGHLVLAVFIGLIVAVPGILGQIGIALPVTPLALLIRVLELFVAFLQAYIFTFLTTLFIAAAVAPEH